MLQWPESCSPESAGCAFWIKCGSKSFLGAGSGYKAMHTLPASYPHPPAWKSSTFGLQLKQLRTVTGSWSNSLGVTTVHTHPFIEQVYNQGTAGQKQQLKPTTEENFYSDNGNKSPSIAFELQNPANHIAGSWCGLCFLQKQPWTTDHFWKSESIFKVICDMA